jgi:hypothetical protein
MEVSDHHDLDALIQGEELCYPLHKRLGGPPSPPGLWRGDEFLHLPEFDPWLTSSWSNHCTYFIIAGGGGVKINK